MTDYTVADTIYLMFTTRAFATGIPTVLAGTPVVSAYENDSLTQITAGITLGVDHDSVVGLNLLTIVATGANGYESGKDYNMVITTGTVGGVSVVGEVVGTFSLGRSAAAVDLANGTDGLGAIKTDTAAILVDTGTTLQAELDAIQAATITNAAGADIAADIIAVKADTAAVLVDTADMQPRVVAIEVDTSTTLQAELDGIQADTEDIQTQIGTAGAGLTDLGGMSTGMKAEINTEVDGAFTTQMADSVSADGAIATREQALYMMLQFLTDFGIVGTTLTARKVDGSTALMTFTLDDGTNPTDLTRAT